MAYTPKTPKPYDQEFLISMASGMRSLDNIDILVGTTERASGLVLGGPLDLKSATLRQADTARAVYTEYDPSGLAGAATVAGILLNAAKVGEGDEYAAAGRIVFSNQPGDDTTITLNGQALTFKASGASGETQVNKGGSLSATLTAAAAKLNAATATTAWTGATYYATATTLEIVHDTAGAAGNAYTVVAGASSNGTALAATLIGGGYAQLAVIVNCDAEVKDAVLNWFSGATDDQKATGIAALRALGIKSRPVVGPAITA